MQPPPEYRPGVNDAKRRLAAESDALLREAEAVRDLERQKRTMPISTPDFHRTADEIAERGRRVFRLAVSEERTGDAAPRGEESIDDVAADRPGRRPG